MTRNEYTANDYLTQQASERARWVAVLAPTAKHIAKRQAVRKNLIAQLFGL